MKNHQSTNSITNSIKPFNRKSRLHTGLLLVAFLCGSFLSMSQSLADFKYASERSKGRELIPFSSIRNEVKTLHDRQVTVTKAAAGYKSARLLEDIKNYIGFQKDVERYLATSEKNLAAYKGEDKSKKDDLEEEIEKNKKDLIEIKDKIKDVSKKLKDGLPKWEAARIRVNEMYHGAYDLVDDAEDDPEKHIGEEPDDEDKAAHEQWKKDLGYFKGYTYKIKSKIQAGYRNHDEKIEEAEDSIGRFKEGLRLI